ncbi:hypothetical protein DB31_1805 [Hyalangium minutum]|uniref:Uncharacterized protein n=1 Tax=Hyalangium minutum TaxID=394096 RepID=A0A085WAS4_9BACT|nr:hypothetical protein DB31_1805 [Hyalangium minutum]
MGVTGAALPQRVQRFLMTHIDSIYAIWDKNRVGRRPQ